MSPSDVRVPSFSPATARVVSVGMEGELSEDVDVCNACESRSSWVENTFSARVPSASPCNGRVPPSVSPASARVPSPVSPF